MNPYTVIPMRRYRGTYMSLRQARRLALARFLAVWSRRIERHRDALALAATLVAGIVIGMGIIIVMLLGRAYQAGLI